MTEFDYVIVGAGSSGCVLANRLAPTAGTRCCCSKPGPRDNYLWIHIPIGYGEDDVPPGLQLGLPHRARAQDARARDLLAARPRPRRLELDQRTDLHPRPARRTTITGRSSATPAGAGTSVLPYFIKLEHNSRGASAYARRRRTAVVLRTSGAKHELMEAIIRGAGELGVPRTDDFNGGDQEGVGYYQLFTRNGWRCSTAVAYLSRRERGQSARRDRRACDRADHVEGRRATGVRYRQDGERRRGARARAKCILSAGALQSPQLLQLSGIGPADAAAAHGIAVVHDAARRRRESAGPSADPPDVPRGEADHDQRRSAQLWRARRASACSGC